MSSKAVVHVLLDFKSGASYLACNRNGPITTVEEDYNVKVVALPFEAKVAELKGWEKVVSGSFQGKERADNVFRHKVENFVTYANLQGLPVGRFEDRSSRLLLIALKWFAANLPDLSLRFAFNGFEAFHDFRQDHTDTSVVYALVKKTCDTMEQVPSIEAFQRYISDHQSEKLIRETSPVSHSERRVFGTPCFVAPNGVMSYLALSLSMIRHELEKDGLSKPGRVPDLACAWRPGTRYICESTIGMPGTSKGPWLQKYHRNSRNASHRNQAKKIIPAYLDVKSPHAYLAIEMAMALEEDFDVHVDFLPFDLALADVYGEAKAPIKKGGGSQVPPPVSFQTEAEREKLNDASKKRTNAQVNLVKWTYADLRRYANVRGITLFGTERVWRSELVLKAMLYCKSFGRQWLDVFQTERVYPNLWKRQLNLEDPDSIRKEVEHTGVPMDQYESFMSKGGHGEQQLREIFLVATQQHGVFGVPSFVVDRKMYWGKEHLSLIRMQLYQEGLAFSTDVPVDIPYLWRPNQPGKSRF